MPKPPRHAAPDVTGSRLAPLPDDLQGAEVTIDGVLYRVLSHPLENTPTDHAAESSTDGLTAAERNIAAAIMMGSSQAEIARSRGTSPRTVGKQIEAIYRKVGVQSRAELMARLVSR